MFEDFSFLSSSTNIPTDISYIDPLQPVSPFSSRCSSPNSPQFPPYTRNHDLRFHSSRTSSVDSFASSSRCLSIETLTSQFDNLPAPFDSVTSPSTPNTSTSSSSENYAPRSIPLHLDEGFDEPASNHSPIFNPASYFDGYSLQSPLVSLSRPVSPSGNNSSNRFPLTFAARRRQRQLLSRLQCLADEGGLDAHLAMFAEDCHPSSMPLPGLIPNESTTCCNRDKDTADMGRRVSITSAGISPLYTNIRSTIPRMGERKSAVVKRVPRLRKRKP